MHESHCLFQICCIPYPLLEFRRFEDGLSLLDQLVSSQLHIFIEQVASEHLLSVSQVVSLVAEPETAYKGLCGKGEVFVVEEGVVVIKKKYGKKSSEFGVLVIKTMVYLQESHVVVPFGVVLIKKSSAERELWANSLYNVKQIEHFLNRFISLLSHTPVYWQVTVI